MPGGIFAPSLAIGAGIGNDVALLSGLDHGSRWLSVLLYSALANAQLKRAGLPALPH